MKRGRKPNTEPATAYEYRRVIFLVQVLAIDKSEGLKLTDLRAIAHYWGLNIYGDFSTLLQRLAQAAIEHDTGEDNFGLSTEERSR